MQSTKLHIHVTKPPAAYPKFTGLGCHQKASSYHSHFQIMLMVICPKPGSFGFYATWGWGEWGGFPLTSSQTIIAEQLVQGRYALSRDRFEPATLRLQGTEHTLTPPHPISKITTLFNNSRTNLPQSSPTIRCNTPSPLRKLFTIQPTHSTWLCSYLTLSRPQVTTHLKFSNRAISITDRVSGTIWRLNSALFLSIHYHWK